MVHCLGVSLLLLAFAGCATTPRWVNKTPDTTVYFVGVGSGETYNSAEVNAYLDMSAFINGTELDAVVDYFQREHGFSNKTSLTEDFRQQIKQYTRSAIPPDVQVVERWQDRQRKWALAVGMRPDMSMKVRRAHSAHLQRVKSRAFIPGLAQLERLQNRKAAVYISGFVIGLAGGISMNSLTGGAIDKRDQARTQVDYDYYDDRANAFYWASNAFYGLAAASYVTSFIDGWFFHLKPYQHLTGRDTVIPGLRVVMGF